MVTMRIGCEFVFDAGHSIPGHAGACRQTHGHTYRLEVVAAGPIGKNGMVMDFSTVKDIVRREVVSILDHQLLNEVVPNPTAEALIEWIWARLQDKLPLSSVRLWEGEGKWVEKTTEG